MEYVIPIKDIDIKEFINFSSVFSKPKKDSQVDLGQKYSDNILALLYQRELLPMGLNKFVQLIQCAIQDNRKIDINFLFLKKIILSYFEDNQKVFITTKSSNLIIDVTRENTQ